MLTLMLFPFSLRNSRNRLLSFMAEGNVQRTDKSAVISLVSKAAAGLGFSGLVLIKIQVLY